MQCGIVRFKNAEFFGVMEIHQQSHIRRGHGVRQFTGITASRNKSPQDEKVYLSHDNGYTYGGITASRFEEVEEETENE